MCLLSHRKKANQIEQVYSSLHGAAINIVGHYRDLKKRDGGGISRLGVCDSHAYNLLRKEHSMSRKRINVSENASTLLLPQDILDEMGVSHGDEVDVTIVDRTVVVMRVDEVGRAQKLGMATASVFKRRKQAYEELAKGAE
jgi:antitoxin component of MazEF toxin-antitoxin module